MQWTTSKLESPDQENSPLNFKHALYSVEFTLNPISVTYQRHHVNHWVLDTLSDLGGFMLFSYLFFSLFCQQIPYRLYYARVLQDTYRVKFNKYLKGIKIKRQDRNRARTHHPVEEYNAEDLVQNEEEGEDEESMNSEERKEAELEEMRDKAQLKEMERLFEEGQVQLEGGDDENQEALTNRSGKPLIKDNTAGMISPLSKKSNAKSASKL